MNGEARDSRSAGTDMSKPPLVPDELLKPVVAYFNPRRVILFGSHARGEAGPDSDYDLMVIVDDDTPVDRLSAEAAYEARRTFHRAVDILPCRERVFQERKGIIGSLANAVSNEGVVVDERR